jgi:exodeoxyribonuclease VII large subunit
VGVVTSPTGAAIRDIVRTIHNRFPARILLAPSQVQGDAAPQALVNALQSLAAVEDVDVIILGRGGGSLQDLWAFNSEILARAVAACPKVVISAVGHEIDTLLTDYVADYRAATPTAAGEAVVPDYQELSLRLREQSVRLGRGLQSIVHQKRDALTQRVARLSDPRRLIRERWQQHDHLESRLVRSNQEHFRQAQNRLALFAQRLVSNHPSGQLRRVQVARENAVTRLQSNWQLLFQNYNNQLGQMVARLQALSPLASLDRGYAIVRHSGTGNVLSSHTEVAVGGRVEILLADGVLDATVNGVRAKEEIA